MMQHSTTTQPQGHGWTRRMRRAFRALVLTGSALALTASVASAKMACNYPPGGGSNTCLTITNLGNGIYSVLVGIDVHESAAEVQRLLNDAQAAGRPLFTALLKADDPGSNDATLSQVPVSWVAGGAGGLSAEFHIPTDFVVTPEGVEVKSSVHRASRWLSHLGAHFVAG